MTDRRTFVSLTERGVPFAGAFAATFGVMVLLGLTIERAVLRSLVNQPPITLFMATLGVAYVIEGTAQLAWGIQVHGLDLGIDDTPIDVAGRRADLSRPVRSRGPCAPACA